MAPKPSPFLGHLVSRIPGHPSADPRHPSPVTRDSLTLFVLALAVHSAVAFFIRQPGYVDAYYYFGGGLRLVQGHGFTEPYLWNYLDDPAGLPHPSHLYWMPLTSIVAAGSMALFGATFRAAQLPFILLASALAPFTYLLARRVSAVSRHAWLAGLLAIFGGFYPPFLANTDAFALYGLLGAGAMLACAVGTDRDRPWLLGIAGALAGLAALTRADGLLLAIVCAAWAARRPRAMLPFLLVFLAVVAPWYWRNTLAVGSPLPPGGLRAAWLRTYDELFSFPASRLTPEHFLAQGWQSILKGRWDGLAANVQTAVAVQGMIFLAPFIAAGLCQLRRRAEFKLALVYYAVLAATMTFVFTFPGMRGGFFHSGAAMLPFFLAAAPVGLDRAVAWAAERRRTWQVGQAQVVFTIGAVVLAAGLSATLVAGKVIGGDWRDPAWNKPDRVYAEAGEWLVAHAASEAVVMVNNPPGFFYHTGLAGIVIPDGSVETMLAAADRHAARYLLLDANVPRALAPLYARVENPPRLRLMQTFSDHLGREVFLYEITRPGDMGHG